MEHEPVPVSKIKSDKDDGDNVKCIRGTITKLFPIKKGDGGSGPYEYQNGEFRDEAGDTIDVTFSKCSQPESAKGQLVTITSVKNDSHGWLGIKIADNTYEKEVEGVKKPVTKRILKIVPSAVINYANGAPAANGPAQTGGGAATQSRPAHTSQHPDLVLKDLIFLHSKCTDLVEQLYGGESGKTPEFRQAATASIFIQGCKEGLHYNFEERIKAPIPKQYPKPPADPKDWDACVVPKGEFEGKTLKELPDGKLRDLYTALKKSDSETPFAKCVYQAAKDRNVLEKPKPPTDPDLDPPEDDIPF